MRSFSHTETTVLSWSEKVNNFGSMSKIYNTWLVYYYHYYSTNQNIIAMIINKLFVEYIRKYLNLSFLARFTANGFRQDARSTLKHGIFPEL